MKIPVDDDAALREPAVHAALEGALAEQGLGTLLGWGASIADQPEARRLTAAFHRIDIEVSDLDRALALLREQLAALAVPAGTEVHYRVRGAAMQEDYGECGWSSRHPLAGH